MQVRFLQSLGLNDINLVKHKTGVALLPANCKEGSVCDVPQAAYELLAGKYPALMEPASVKGEAKQPEITAPKK